jgi:HAD superfamily hydrolase (TIGR01509 family)
MAAVAEIRAIVVGVEGVLVRLTVPARHAPWERRLGLAPGGLAYDVLQSPSSCRACLGLMEEADVWMELSCLFFRLHADELAALAEDFWGGMSVDVELRDVILGLRSRLPIAGLSNAWPGARERYVRRFGMAYTFDELILSCEERLVKPDTRIYELAAARLGVSPAHTLLVDGDPRHVAGARDAGLQALRYVSAGQLIADLDRLLEHLGDEELVARVPA